MKRFDEKFADNVREVFDSYDESVDPAAWADMQRRLKRPERPLLIPLIPRKVLGAAAAVMLLAATGLLFWQTAGLKNANGPEAISHAPGRSAVTQPVNPQREPIVVAGQAEEPALAAHQPHKQVQKQLAESRTEPEPIQAAETLIAELEMLAAIEVAAQDHDPDSSLVTLPWLPGPSQPNPLMSTGQQIDPFKGIQPATNQRAQSWSVAAGSMLAFANSKVSDGAGYAAGVMSEWKISPAITLSTGGLLAYHQFELVSMGGGNNRLYYDNSPDFSAGNGFTFTRDNQYELLTLDIPLNAQFSLSETNRMRLYFGAGLSSVVFLQQRFTSRRTRYYNEWVIDPASGQQISLIGSELTGTDEQHDAFSRMDIGRLMNLSFGYVVKGQNGSYVIEPFMKYPLGRITSRDMKLGMGGISLRYNFAKP